MMNVYGSFPPKMNIVDLPPKNFNKVAQLLEPRFREFVSSLRDSPIDQDEIEGFALQAHSGQSVMERVLRKLGSKGRTVEYLTMALDNMRHERALLCIKGKEPVVIIEQPESSVIIEGDNKVSKSLRCHAKSFPYPTYQWFKLNPNSKEWVRLKDETRPTLWITDSSDFDAGTYTYCCRVHNTHKEDTKFSSTSEVQVLRTRVRQVEDHTCKILQERSTVVRCEYVPNIPAQCKHHTSHYDQSHPFMGDVPAAPVITEQPQSREVDVLDTIQLTCSGRGCPPPHYQWVKDGFEMKDEDKCVLVIERARAEHGGCYWCVLNNAHGSQNTEKANLKIRTDRPGGKKVIPEIVKQPSSATVEDGGMLILNCEATGLGQLHYQWYHNGNLLQGKTHSDLEIPELSHQHDGVYVCKVQNACGECLSKEAKVQAFQDVGHQFTAINKVALLIGNKQYTSEKPLNAPTKDIHEMRLAFEQLDFCVVSLSDLQKDEMLNAIGIFCRMISEGVYGVFYFAGHGFEQGGQCYLVPTDAKANYGPDDCVCAEFILQEMQNKKPGLSVLMLDICRKTNDHGSSKEPIITYQPKVTGNTVFCYATTFTMSAFESVKGADPRAEPNGIFVKYLKQYVTKRRNIMAMFQDVQRAVGNDPDAKHLQFPEIRSNLRENRTFADKVYYKGKTHVYTNTFTQWKLLHVVPDIRIVEIDVISVEIKLSFEALNCNVLRIIPKVLNSGTTVKMFVWVEDKSSQSKTQYTPDGVPMDTPKDLVVCNLQRLQGELEVTLKIFYKLERFQNVLSETVRLGRPLVAGSELWKSNRPLFAGRTPVEQEDDGGHGDMNKL